MLQCSGNIILSKIREGKMVKYLKEFKFENFMVFLLITIDIALAVLSSVFLANVLNSLIAKEMNQFFLWLAIDIILWMVDSFVQGARDVWKEIAIQKQLNAVRRDIIEPLTEISYSDFEKNSKEDYNSWLNNDAILLDTDGYKEIYFMIENIFLVLFSSFALFTFHWILFATTLGLALILLILPKLFQKKMVKATQEVSNSAEKALKESNDKLKGYEVIYHNQQFDFLTSRLLQVYEQLKAVKISKAKLVSTAMMCTVGLSFLSQSVILGVNALLAFQHIVLLGTLLVSGNFAGNIFNGLNTIADCFTIALGTDKLLTKYPKVSNQRESKSVSTFEKKLSFENVSIKLGDKKITYPNFEIKKGKKYAIVGESGSGKTTLIQLLNGDLEDYQGTIKLDGLDYKIIDKGKLQSIIATISQFPYLFNDSLEENLKMNREITDEKLEKVLKEVKAEDFLKGKLTNKFDNNLSGGQQQRVAIARELLGEKPILIMDESTASLDKLTALAVEQNILQNPSLTVIMITHHFYDETRPYFDEVIEL